MGSSQNDWPSFRGAFFRSASRRRRAVLLQQLDGEIERAGDQTARRRIYREATDRGESRLDIGFALRGNAVRARDPDDGIRGQAFLLMRNRHRYDAASEPGEILQEAFAVLG